MLIQILYFILILVVFCAVGAVCNLACVKFLLPRWVFWLVGALLIIVFVIYIANYLGLSLNGGAFPFHHHVATCFRNAHQSNRS